MGDFIGVVHTLDKTEHPDPSWIKRVKNKQIPEYADPLEKWFILYL